MPDPECMYVSKALLLGEGVVDVNMVLILERDGRYRKATGDDLIRIHEKAPGFIKATQVRLAHDG